MRGNREAATISLTRSEMRCDDHILQLRQAWRRGRVLDHTPGTAEVLSQIARAVGRDLVVLVDGGVRSGLDVLKMLALGAHAVLVGRPLAVGAIGAGVDGVRLTLEQMHSELKVAMIFTGCASVCEIGEEALWR